LVAISSLKRMYQKYGNWITVVAAYNCGEGCVDGAIKKKGSQNYVDFAVFLPQETLSHVDKFIEACYITGDFKDVMVHKQFYTFVQEQEQEKIITTEEAMFSTTEITSSFNLNVLSEEIGFPLTEILKWNPLIEKEIATTGVGTLRLPVDKMPDFLLMKHTILNKSLLVQK
uniref:transglycosylase SLT domain-containing protein n=1 Tax=Capnocytophaga canis TaxID=1848903 RepID=UPI001562DB1A